MVRSETIEVDGFDEVFRVECGGAVAYVALHAVIGGHAFGGIRIHEYDTEAAALDDAKALALAMSRKVVMAGIEGGGGKTVMALPASGDFAWTGKSTSPISFSKTSRPPSFMS